MFFNFFADWARQLDGEISVYNEESLFIFHTNDFLGAQLWLQKFPCHEMFPNPKMIVEALHVSRYGTLTPRIWLIQLLGSNLAYFEQSFIQYLDLVAWHSHIFVAKAALKFIAALRKCWWCWLCWLCWSLRFQRNYDYSKVRQATCPLWSICPPQDLAELHRPFCSNGHPLRVALGRNLLLGGHFRAKDQKDIKGPSTWSESIRRVFSTSYYSWGIENPAPIVNLSPGWRPCKICKFELTWPTQTLERGWRRSGIWTPKKHQNMISNGKSDVFSAFNTIFQRNHGLAGFPGLECKRPFSHPNFGPWGGLGRKIVWVNRKNTPCDNVAGWCWIFWDLDLPFAAPGAPSVLHVSTADFWSLPSKWSGSGKGKTPYLAVRVPQGVSKRGFSVCTDFETKFVSNSA